MKIDMFLNDNYKLLKLLYENQTIILEKKVIPLTQAEICSALNMGKVKVNGMFVEMQKQGLIIQQTRGKYCLTDSAEDIIKLIEMAK
ncbi:MAG: hypothetical protein HDQ95_03605 [Roseburia sp.]|nr:hypothetical protein [Roseburia sp.]